MTDLTIENVTWLAERYSALQHPREALNLLRFLSKDPPSLIIELGVWRGGNAALLKTFFPEARLIGVDVLGPDDPDSAFAAVCVGSPGSASLRATMDEFGIEMVRGSSQDQSTLDEVVGMIDRKADYIFIDAAHDADSVRRDFKAWSPYAHRVGFHDLHNPMIYPVWLEITGMLDSSPRTFAVWKELDGHGIGVVLT